MRPAAKEDTQTKPRNPTPRKVSRQGFALLLVLILLILAGVAVITLSRMIPNWGGNSKNQVTRQRMAKIAAAASQYYQGHLRIPAPAANHRVPTQALALNSRLAYDGWGHPLHYDCTPDNIRGTSVNGLAFAGVIVSGGPSQAIENGTWPGSGTTYQTTGDDIVREINLQSAAITIATETLHSLAHKSCSFKCNGGDLDDELNENNVISQMIEQFSLNPLFYDKDPWGNPYQWRAVPKQFRSFGPDGRDDTSDDIVVSAATILNNCVCGGSPLPVPRAHFSFEPDQVKKKGRRRYTIRIPNQNPSKKPIRGRFKGNTDWVKYNDSSEIHNTAPPPTNSAGDYCVYFDGNGDYIIMKRPKYFRLNEDFTLTAWFKTEGRLNAYAKVISRRSGSYKYYFLGSKGTSGNTRCGSDSTHHAHPYGGVLGGYSDYQQGGHQTTTRNLIDMPCGEWHHVAVVFDYEPNDKSSLAIYYDGDLQERRENLPVSPPDDRGIRLTIGADAGGTMYFFQGWIDETYIFDEALSEEQIKQVMADGA